MALEVPVRYHHTIINTFVSSFPLWINASTAQAAHHITTAHTTHPGHEGPAALPRPSRANLAPGRSVAEAKRIV
eukprot:634011-Pyramimonas_sp.AAC.2